MDPFTKVFRTGGKACLGTHSPTGTSAEPAVPVHREQQKAIIQVRARGRVLQVAILSKLVYLLLSFKNWQRSVQWFLEVNIYYHKELFKISEAVT